MLSVAAVAADSDAIVIIGFDETTKILTGLIEAGAGPADKNIYAPMATWVMHLLRHSTTRSLQA